MRCTRCDASDAVHHLEGTSKRNAHTHKDGQDKQSTSSKKIDEHLCESCAWKHYPAIMRQLLPQEAND